VVARDRDQHANILFDLRKETAADVGQRRHEPPQARLGRKLVV
jgi:hypothetical protein